MTCYIPRWFTCPQTVTHPSTLCIDACRDAYSLEFLQLKFIRWLDVRLGSLQVSYNAQNTIASFQPQVACSSQTYRHRKTRGHSCKVVKLRNCLDLTKYFFSAQVVDRWNRLDQEDIDNETVNGCWSKLEKKCNTKTCFFMDKASLDPGYSDPGVVTRSHQVGLNNQVNNFPVV